MSESMEKEVYNAAVVGDVTVFSNKKEEQLLRKTSQNNNIIHIAAQHQQVHFIQAAFNSLPKTPTCESLICDQNRHGNTPLHIAAEVGDEAVVHKLYEYFTVQCGSDSVFPWRVMNKYGNTPAHVALLYGNVSLAVYLVEKDGYLAGVVNRSKETLLHLAIQYHVFDNNGPQKSETQAPGGDLSPIIELLLKIDSSVTCWEDANGATPLHRATSLKPAYCVPVIKAMLASCPEADEVYDEGSGQTILHRLTNHKVASYEQGLELLHIPQVYALRNIKDHQGDTPLHLASRNRDNIMVQVLLASSAKLCIQNMSGVSAGTLVRQLEEMRFKETTTEDRRRLMPEEHEAAQERNIAFLKEKLVSLGTNFLVSRTPNGGNILHLLMQCKFDEDAINETEEFIRQAIQKVPLLIRQKDCNGDNMEVEVKLRLPDSKAHQSLSTVLSPFHKQTHFQHNVFFDGAAGELSSRRAVLRLRFYGEDSATAKRCVVSLKAKALLVDGVSRVEEDEEEIDPDWAREIWANPNLIGSVESRILKRVRDEFGIKAEENDSDGGKYVCLGGFKNVRGVYEWNSLTLELDETLFDFGTLYEVECESAEPDKAKELIEGLLKQSEIPYTYSAKSKFAIFISGKLPEVACD
ncbi:uncharacterized protein LOC141606102 isoform X1 [Silene latifolia]|uniref:uncharacterized protein LOC141606102 isoform X1 n=2 Tax=Silene latifolia TaxID=37657 RepID=UPI003D776E97